MTMAINQDNTVRDDFHLYLPTPGKHIFTGCQNICRHLSHLDSIPLSHLDRANIHEFSKACLADPWMKDLVGQWTDGLNRQFYGITTDGVKVEGLYELKDEGAPTQAAVS